MSTQPSKPRIKRVFGIWCCGIPGERFMFKGFFGDGYTPLEAYQDWMKGRAR